MTFPSAAAGVMLAANQRRGGIMGRHPVRATLFVVAFLLAGVARAAAPFDWTSPAKEFRAVPEPKPERSSPIPAPKN